MKSLLFVLAVTSALIVISCDVVDAPYLKNPIDPSDTLLKDTSDVVVRTGAVQNVLLEDYTGHTCGNCPAAADVAKEIVKKNPGRVLVLAVHCSDQFAAPQLPDYPYDFRTIVGTTLDATFRNSRAGLPNGLVNRTKYDSKFILSQNSWDPATTAQLALSPKMGLDLSHTYHADKRTIVATVKAEYFAQGEPDYSVVVFIIENGIVQDQTDYRFTPSHIEDYDFEHVLRASMNGTWGDSLSRVSEPAGKKITKTLRYVIPEGVDWKLENCELVAFVIRRKDDQTREVLQVVKQQFRP
ncbi:MAG: Omp28-related outer membrane protein [Candidatus Kapabacteria bacterium]|nr:Omp28-related outer membrane protein [Candidatus Kapabacteria bacterium]